MTAEHAEDAERKSFAEQHGDARDGGQAAGIEGAVVQGDQGVGCRAASLPARQGPMEPLSMRGAMGCRATFSDIAGLGVAH